jgi:hypothetical protein
VDLREDSNAYLDLGGEGGLRNYRAYFAGVFPELRKFKETYTGSWKTRNWSSIEFKFAVNLFSLAVAWGGSYKNGEGHYNKILRLQHVNHCIDTLVRRAQRLDDGVDLITTTVKIHFGWCDF